MRPATPKELLEMDFSIAEMKALKNRVQELECANSELRKRCLTLCHAQEGLEMVLGETNQKLLEGEMLAMELGAIFSAASDATCVVRDDHLVIRANQAMLKLLGKSEKKVLGQNINGLWSQHLNHEASSKILSVFTTGLREECDLKFVNAHKKPEYYIVSASPLVTIDGSPGIVVQFKDITLRKQAEIDLARAKKELEIMARFDALTKLSNRRTFDEALSREWERGVRKQSQTSLIICDIDYFKRYNDHYGHQQGDDCLFQVAQALATCVKRPADLAARYGGEEFVLLLPETPSENAQAIAECARKKVETMALSHAASGVSAVVTISLGVACRIAAQENSPQDLLRAADKALYSAKEQGRNRVVGE